MKANLAAWTVGNLNSHKRVVQLSNINICRQRIGFVIRIHRTGVHRSSVTRLYFAIFMPTVQSHFVIGIQMAERKHGRDSDEEEGASLCKRFHGLISEAEELIHMLEDAEEEPNVADEEVVCGVMKSLEEEIASCGVSKNSASAEAIRSADSEETENEMSFLLSASDDELGIPSVIDSAIAEAPIPEILESGLWCFEDYNCNLVPSVYEEGYERDFGSCGGLFEVPEGDPTLSCRQESICAM